LRESIMRRLPYEPRQLFDLVGDVERYPDFVPWVLRLTTHERRVDSDGVVTLEADAQVGFSIVRERFSTRVRLDAPNLAIDVSLISGPFRTLANHWRFSPAPAGAEVIFSIEFEFRSRLLTALFAANAPRAVNSLMGCFEARAQALYGASPTAASKS
jgi:coenzyme Q-binding protein COQ10